MNIAIITGASAGLGKEYFNAVVKKYKYDEIWLIGRRADRLIKLASLYPSVKVRVLELDLSKDSSFEEIGTLLEKENPVVRMLINCAGVGNFGDIPHSDVKTEVNMVDVNIRAVVALTTMTLKYMCSDSRILNVSSIASFAPTPGMTVYSCTKIFIQNYSRSLNRELKGTGIRVLAVCPGPMETEFIKIANIDGKSKKFDAMPHCDPKKVVAVSLKKLEEGAQVYTPRMLLKLYRAVVSTIPSAIVVKLTDLR